MLLFSPGPFYDGCCILKVDGSFHFPGNFPQNHRTVERLSCLKKALEKLVLNTIILSELSPFAQYRVVLFSVVFREPRFTCL